ARARCRAEADAGNRHLRAHAPADRRNRCDRRCRRARRTDRVRTRIEVLRLTPRRTQREEDHGAATEQSVEGDLDHGIPLRSIVHCWSTLAFVSCPASRLTQSVQNVMFRPTLTSRPPVIAIGGWYVAPS